MSTRLLRLSFPVLVLAMLPACGPKSPHIDLASGTKEAWNALNDPLNLRDDYEVRLASLPLSADTSQKPWSDTYWPNYEGGLANRWNDPARPDAFSYPLLSAAAVSGLNEEALSRMSPAEKYDVYMGRFDYPLVRLERQRTSPEDPSWFGLCHGWAPAALNYVEPNPVTVAGPGGVSVPFGSSDVKALLLYAQQYGDDTRMAGDRCNGGADPACRDINAGSFHVILANQIGIDDRGFVAEVARGAEVWNQPVYGFTTEIRGESDDVDAGAAPGTVKVVTVRTTMRYVAESGPSWTALPFDQFPGQQAARRYEYMLELNAAGEIVGGEWISADHPDFFWIQPPFAWTGYFARLQAIYEASIARL